MAPRIESIKRVAGVAGEFAYRVRVEWDGLEGDEADVQEVSFVSSTFGGPIVMVTESGMQTFIGSAVLDRIGRTLNEAWVRSFFSDEEV